MAGLVATHQPVSRCVLVERRQSGFKLSWLKHALILARIFVFQCHNNVVFELCFAVHPPSTPTEARGIHHISFPEEMNQGRTNRGLGDENLLSRSDRILAAEQQMAYIIRRSLLRTRAAAHSRSRPLPAAPRCSARGGRCRRSASRHPTNRGRYPDQLWPGRHLP